MTDTKAKTRKTAWLCAALAAVAVAATLAASGAAQGALDDSGAARSQEYAADISLSSLSVALQENGATCAETRADGASTSYDGLLADLNGGKALSFGRLYPEVLSAYNDGDQDEYVRVVVNRYWKQPGGKATGLDPALIMVDFDEGAWVVVEDASSPEQAILYSRRPLAPGESLPFATRAGVSAGVLAHSRVIEAAGGAFAVTQYDYDSYVMGIDVEVSAVQTHSAAEAIRSSWGIDVADVHGTGQAIEVVG